MLDMYFSVKFAFRIKVMEVLSYLYCGEKFKGHDDVNLQYSRLHVVFAEKI